MRAPRDVRAEGKRISALVSMLWVVEGPENGSEHPHELLHFGGSHVGLLAEKVVEIVPVVRKPRFPGSPAFQRLAAEGDELGVHEGNGCAHASEGALGSVVNCRGLLVGRVHAGAEAGGRPARGTCARQGIPRASARRRAPSVMRRGFP